MFTRELYNIHSGRAAKESDPAAPNYRLADYGYGKQGVRVFQVRKDGPLHTVTEFMVSSHLRLRTQKEYFNADNSDIIGSDEQESNIYIHSQKYGLTTPEEFALSLSEHFLNTYDQVTDANVVVESLSWPRLGENEMHGYYKDRPHNHAFIRDTNCKRFCEVVHKRDKQPLIIAGISGLRILKTAQAPFTGYVKSALVTEGDMTDRILCTDVNARWQYSPQHRIADNIDFSTHWFRVRDVILHSFAGDPKEGVITTSVQFVAYAAERAVLDAMPEICSVSITLPNYKNFPYDFSKFPPIEPKADVIISNPYEAPIGIGYAQLDRKNVS